MLAHQSVAFLRRGSRDGWDASSGDQEHDLSPFCPSTPPPVYRERQDGHDSLARTPSILSQPIHGHHPANKMISEMDVNVSGIPSEGEVMDTQGESIALPDFPKSGLWGKKSILWLIKKSTRTRGSRKYSKGERTGEEQKPDMTIATGNEDVQHRNDWSLPTEAQEIDGTPIECNLPAELSSADIISEAPGSLPASYITRQSIEDVIHAICQRQSPESHATISKFEQAWPIKESILALSNWTLAGCPRDDPPLYSVADDGAAFAWVEDEKAAGLSISSGSSSKVLPCNRMDTPSTQNDFRPFRHSEQEGCDEGETHVVSPVHAELQSSSLTASTGPQVSRHPNGCVDPISPCGQDEVAECNLEEPGLIDGRMSPPPPPSTPTQKYFLEQLTRLDVSCRASKNTPHSTDAVERSIPENALQDLDPSSVSRTVAPARKSSLERPESSPPLALDEPFLPTDRPLGDRKVKKKVSWGNLVNPPDPAGREESASGAGDESGTESRVDVVPHENYKAINPWKALLAATVSSLSATVSETSDLLQEYLGVEKPVTPGQVRIRWTCKCGEELYDDFIEVRPGAAAELEAKLKSIGTRTLPTTSHTSQASPGSSNSSSPISASSSAFNSVPSSATSIGSLSSFPSNLNTPTSNRPKPNLSSNRRPRYLPYPPTTPLWLLTCANEGKWTPKVTHLDVHPALIRSDRDLALALRDHYARLHHRWPKALKLRGLSSIHFVQFELHRNRFADIRKVPDVPPAPPLASRDQPAVAEPLSSASYQGCATAMDPSYEFETTDLIPPVGSHYLMHLLRHPSDYDGELIAYLRTPKRRGRLDVGVGWGIALVEGYLPLRVWGMLVVLFVLGSLVFAVTWTVRSKGDLQGAFGVAAWVSTIAALTLGWAQAYCD